MKLNEALSQILILPYIGNKPSSERSAKHFENEVTNILRNVGEVIERPHGANQSPACTINNMPVIIRTSKGNKIMWNENLPDRNGLLILNLKFGTVVVHGSLIISEDNYNILVEAKKETSKILKERFNTNGNFKVAGGRIQFKDTIDWENMRIQLFRETIERIEKCY